MTSKTSLFNPGIYINILKRFKWGSFLYAVALFFSVPFVFLMQNPQQLARQPIVNGVISNQTILQNGYMAIPFLLALFVPTITAILIQGSVHSVKQGVFVHSLPVNRSANYVSAVLGGATLMAAPVVLNAFILAIMSICGYSAIISLWSIFVWAAMQGAVMFIMFSVAVISGFLTGHKVAHAIINIVLHTFSLLVALSVYLISDVFLFGFIESESFVATRIAMNTPVVWLFRQFADSYQLGAEMFKTLNLWIYVFGAAVLYGLSYYLYTKRKIEACGEVAAFYVFRPILKYTITTAAAVCTLGIMWATELGAAATFIVAAAISAIAYFACEMLLSKTVKVFGKYKGYCIFALSMAAVICFCAFTSVFGYETRIPDKENIAKASFYTGYYPFDTPPLVEDSDTINSVTDFHDELLSHIPLTQRSLDYLNTPYIAHLVVRYELKDGGVLERRYPMTAEMQNKILSRMYECPDYKMMVTKLNLVNIENVPNVMIRTHYPGHNFNFALNDNSVEFMKALKKDIQTLSYNEMDGIYRAIELNVAVELSKEENDIAKVFDDSMYSSPNANPYEMQSFNININSNYKNTIAFLKEKGYYNDIMNSFAENLRICHEPVIRKGEEITFKNDKGETDEFRVALSDCSKLSPEDSFKLAELMFEREKKDTRDGENYVIFFSRENAESIWLSDMDFSFTSAELPEFLRKYVE